MAKLLLYVALVNFGRGGKTGAQRVTREFESAFDLGQSAANTGGDGLKEVGFV
jgi:hypothetical protein